MGKYFSGEDKVLFVLDDGWSVLSHSLIIRHGPDHVGVTTIQKTKTLAWTSLT